MKKSIVIVTLTTVFLLILSLLLFGDRGLIFRNSASEFSLDYYTSSIDKNLAIITDTIAPHELREDAFFEYTEIVLELLQGSPDWLKDQQIGEILKTKPLIASKKTESGDRVRMISLGSTEEVASNLRLSWLYFQWESAGKINARLLSRASSNSMKDFVCIGDTVIFCGSPLSIEPLSPVISAWRFNGGELEPAPFNEQMVMTFFEGSDYNGYVDVNNLVLFDFSGEYAEFKIEDSLGVFSVLEYKNLSDYPQNNAPPPSVVNITFEDLLGLIN